MKKISIILTVFALAMTMSQCKKNEGQPTSNDEVVTITLDVKQNNGSKVVVNPNTGTVDFETGDKIYVGSGGKYVGFLTHNGTNFVGNITNPTEDQPLQFYFLGNVTPQETLSAGTTEECSVIISDQTEHLPVISCAASNENYVSGVTAYSAHLLNKCALVKFNVTTPSNSPICITGMKNKVTVDFTQNTMTPSMDGEGVIMLPAGSGENVEKWAILLPQEALEEGEEESAYSEDGTYTGIRPTISMISENDYMANGIAITVNTTADTGVPEGAVNGLFTINSNGNQVYFSQGNLQYIGSAGNGDVNNTGAYWKFAEKQWDYFGNNGQVSISKTIDRDLFGWGTSNYDHGAICYQPWNISSTNNQYYAYGDWQYNLYDQTGQADWGYNAIINGGNVENNGWRTLTTEEWVCVLTIRSASTVNGVANARFAKAVVADVYGLILFPDSYEHPMGVAQPIGINETGAGWNGSNYTAIDFALMEANGAIFLPSAGDRTDTNYFDNDHRGSYWSSSHHSSISYDAYCVKFSSYSVSGNTVSSNSYNGLRYGYSVRLVHNSD